MEAPTSFANCLLVPALPDFHCQYPDITIALSIIDRTIHVVGEGVDCAIRAGKLQDVAMVARKLAELRYATCASTAYLQRMAYAPPSSPENCQANHLHAGFFFFSATRRPESLILEKGSQHYEIDHCHFATNEGSGLINLMLAGFGIGPHVRRFVQPYLDSGPPQNRYE
ncbi:Transcriptional regulator, LysR family (fragment) [Cupriavidus taiwanensis]|uniref:Transcriptional regulator, LysR family n=2 Tax=Cupriavidus taiwanensis TaxID=164546 RepID=A0A375C812_9BURK